MMGMQLFLYGRGARTSDIHQVGRKPLAITRL